MFERLKEALTGYANHLTRLHSMESIDQSHVDQILPRNVQATPTSAHQETLRLPKGIDKLTLEKIREVLAGTDTLFSAEEVGTLIGASRTTARRYLEYLVSTKELLAQVSYGSVGRPERRYQCPKA